MAADGSALVTNDAAKPADGSAVTDVSPGLDAGSNADASGVDVTSADASGVADVASGLDGDSAAEATRSDAASVGADGACHTVTCNSVNMNPPELTFEANYCLGSPCRNATTQAECESLDIITDCGRIASGKDGVPDCRWATSAGAQPACTNSK